MLQSRPDTDTSLIKETVKGPREGMVDCMADEFIMVIWGMLKLGASQEHGWLTGWLGSFVSFLPGYSAFSLLRCAIIRLVAYSRPLRNWSWAWKVLSSLTVSIDRG